jgi:hypothetical protein
MAQTGDQPVLGLPEQVPQPDRVLALAAWPLGWQEDRDAWAVALVGQRDQRLGAD